MPPLPAKGAGRKGVAKFCRFPAAGRESCDLNCTGREPSLAGRATTGPMARMNEACVGSLFIYPPTLYGPTGRRGLRTDPVGLFAANWRGRLALSGTGQPFYPVLPSRKG